MKIDTNSNTFRISILSLSVFVLVMLFVIFPVQNLFVPTPISKINTSNISPNIQNGPITTGTIVNTTKVFVNNANVSGTQQFLDSAGCQNNAQPICNNSSPKFVINVQSVLFDSNQKQYPSSAYINIPTQSLLPTSLSWFSNTLSFISGQKTFPVYSQGKLLDNVHTLTLTDSQNPNINLDLGSVQVVFYGVVPQDTNVIAYGDYAVYLDDQMRANGHFAAQGNTVNQQIPMVINNLPALTFTFSDEGQNWVNGTQHIYRITIGNVTATTGSGTSTTTFQFPKTSLGYILVMTLNDAKKTIIGADNQAIAVFKSDDTLTSCGQYPSVDQTSNAGSGEAYTSYSLTQVNGIASPNVVLTSNGFVLGKISSETRTLNINSQNPDSLQGQPVGQQFCDGVISNVPRNSVLGIVVNGVTQTIQTPVTQSNILVTPTAITGATVLK